MITRYTPYKEMVDEFFEDRQRARYWQERALAHSERGDTTHRNFMRCIHSSKDERRSEPAFYDSPKTDNRWMLWYKFISVCYGCPPDIKDFQVLYALTEAYMTIWVPTTIEQGGEKRRGVSLYTDHLFLRIHQRLGVDMTDRLLVIRNFVEQTCMSILDIRPPREGEDDDQVVMRFPRSWLRGHIRWVGERYMIRFNTFYTDKELTVKQRRDLKAFAKFADAFDTKGEIKDYFHAGGDSNKYFY